MDLLDPGTYDAKLAIVSPVWDSPGFDPYENVAAKVIRSSTLGNVMDMDLIDPGFYSGTIVRSSTPSLEGLQEDSII